jgi:hypothetical protein
VSRTKAHRPWRLVREAAYETRDYSRPEWRWHMSASGRSNARLQRERRRFWHAARNAARVELATGAQPEPTRTRHSVLWDFS